MLKSLATAVAVSAASFLSVPHAAIAQEETAVQPVAPLPTKTGYAAANGLNYYYEIRGEGAPLLLLHGGLGSIDMFAPIMPSLADGRTVIAVDLQGHGRTELGDRPIDLKAIGNDMGVVLKSLGYDKVDVLGYSFGAGVGMQFAVQHPDMVDRAALVSAGYAQDGFYPDMIAMQATMNAGMADMMKETPMYKSYMAVAPKPEDFPRLLQAIGDYMRQPYDFSADVVGLTMPVMLVFGDSDMYRPEHIVKFYQMLGGGLRDAGWMRETMSKNRLAIIPNRTHYDIFFNPELVSTVMPFLNKQDAVKTWDDVVSGK